VNPRTYHGRVARTPRSDAPAGGRFRPTQPQLRRLALASIAANVGIVVTGGAVRLTGSGLGCPTWPRCEGESFVPTGELGLHGQIEFGNRMLTYVVGVVALATLVGAYRARPVRRDVRRLALALFIGIPAQAVVGGVSVLTDLNPWVVMCHLLISMGLIGLATLLHRRLGEGDCAPRPLVVPLTRRLSWALLGLVAVVLYLGTVVTGSGPHAGDDQARRTGLDTHLVSMVHADAVILLVGLTVALLVAARSAGAPGAVRRALAVMLCVELGQGLIGYVQYFTDLPVALVAAHMFGAGLLVIAAVRAVLSMRTRDVAGTPPVPAPAAGAAAPAASTPA
jgi:cytochrome c oxidase assembly protein subunit 15